MRCISKNSAPCMVIALAENATQQEKYAASELRYYLGLITKAHFQIVTESCKGPAILIGQAAKGRGFEHEADLGEDGFWLCTKDGDLAIVGGKRGVIYGVYEFLERLGCRFFTPLCEKVPVYETLELPEIDDTQVPVLEYREHNYADMVRYSKFAVKCRLNGHYHPIREKHGGHLSYAWFVHTLENMISPKDYYHEHPEYFALVDGERPVGFEQYQLCLTNPDVLRICTEKVRAALLENPQARLISISQNDWPGNCTCESCKKSDEEEGSPAGTLLKFVNAIAEALEEEFPHVIFDTLAYQYTRPVPLKTRPRKNVCVRLCSIECCFAHSFETCDDTSRGLKRVDGTISSFMSDLEAWGKICDRMYIWDYTTCFAHYATPHPNWNVLQPNMQAFVRNNVKGVYEQANGAVGGGVDLNELRAYIISKLLWDANTDVERHIREFTDYYYGDAAPFIREYIRTLTEKAEKDNIHVGFNDHPTHGFLSEEMLDIYDEIFDKAERAVQGDPQRLYRVSKARLAIRYVRLRRKAMLKGETDAKELRDFFLDWQSFGLTRMEEWTSPQTSHRAFLAGKWRGVEFYQHWKDEGEEEL